MWRIPTLAFSERVEQVQGPVERLHGHQRLTPPQLQAAHCYRDAWDLVQASPGGSLDLDRVRGAVSSGSAPAPVLMAAAGILADATRILGRHVLVIEASVGYGYSVRDTAARLLRPMPKRGDVEFMGRLIRESLGHLASEWYPAGRRGSIGTWHGDGTASLLPQYGEMTPGGTAHASARKVTRQ